jgi:hypothetical protein
MSDELDELKKIVALIQANNELLQAQNEMLARFLKIKSLLSPEMESRVFSGFGAKK